MIGSIYSDSYKEFRLSEDMVKFTAGVIANNTMLLNVVKEIASRDLCLLIKDPTLKDCIFGSTKEDIRKAFPIESKSSDKEAYISVKVIDKYIGYLCGAALICYIEDGGKKKRYVYSERGIQVLRELAQRGLISMKDIEKNNKLKRR